jgi:chromosomal replication initiation ATPase DnaA
MGANDQVSAGQLSLALPQRQALGRADFLIAPCNAAACALIDHWPDWPVHAALIYGPEGSGKSHLVRVWCLRAPARVIDAENLTAQPPDELLGSARALALEDVDRRMGEGAAERALLHLYNLLAERQGTLLLTARQAASQWPTRLPDLASRVRALPTEAIREPDDALLGALLGKLFADRQIRVEPPLITYLLTRIERSFAAARAIVAALDQAALAAGRPITVPLARTVLARSQPDEATPET